MFFNNIKHNAFIFLCILFSMYGCNKENKKLIVENKVAIKNINNIDKLPLINDLPNENKTKNTAYHS